MPLFYKGIQAAKANKEGVKTWHPALVNMALEFEKSGKSGGYAVAGGKYCREVLTDAG